jgi:hypothetical protein
VKKYISYDISNNKLILIEMTEENAGNISPKNDLEPFVSSGLEINDKMLEDDFEKVYKNYPLNEDTTCGFCWFRGSFLQK